MVDEPVLALAVSSREWPDRLSDWLADHGGARVRVTALRPQDLVEDDHDVLFIDDISSFLSLGLIQREQRAGRVVVGVYDPAEPAGFSYLETLGVDAVVAMDQDAETFVMVARRGRPSSGTRADRRTTGTAVPSPSHRPIVAVRGVSGGVGVSEIALSLGAHLTGAVVVELGDFPSIAQRSGVGLHPNLATAAELVDHAGLPAAGALQRVAGAVDVLVGVADRLDVGRGPVRRVVESLAETVDWTVLDLGAAIEAMLPADHEVLVSLATPVGIRRCLDALRARDVETTHIVLNRAPRGGFERAEVMRVVLEEVRPRSLTIVPEDPAVSLAGWNGRLVGASAFRRAISAVADALRSAA